MTSAGREIRPFILVVAVVTGCAGGTRTDPAAHMDEHFAAGVDLQTAVIRGDLAEARKHAEWLAEHDEPARQVQTEATSRALRDAALEVTRAQDLPTAALATARMAGACGECHERVGAGPDFRPGSPPESGPGAQTAMFGHIWAADRMWEALVARSEVSWEEGARALRASRLNPREVASDSLRIAALQSVVTRVSGLADRAAGDRTWSARAETYGELLTTCSSCHAHLGIDPLGLPRAP